MLRRGIAHSVIVSAITNMVITMFVMVTKKIMMKITIMMQQ